MTRYEELWNEIETATTKKQLADVKAGIASAHTFRRLTQDEAQELWDEVEKRLRWKKLPNAE